MPKVPVTARSGVPAPDAWKKSYNQEMLFNYFLKQYCRPQASIIARLLDAKDNHDNVSSYKEYLTTTIGDIIEKMKRPPGISKKLRAGASGARLAEKNAVFVGESVLERCFSEAHSSWYEGTPAHWNHDPSGDSKDLGMLPDIGGCRRFPPGVDVGSVKGRLNPALVRDLAFVQSSLGMPLWVVHSSPLLNIFLITIPIPTSRGLDALLAKEIGSPEKVTQDKENGATLGQLWIGVPAGPYPTPRGVFLHFKRPQVLTKSVTLTRIVNLLEKKIQLLAAQSDFGLGVARVAVLLLRSLTECVLQSTQYDVMIDRPHIGLTHKALKPSPPRSVTTMQCAF